MRKIRTNLLNPVSPTQTEYLENHLIAWDDDGIQSVRPYDPTLDKDAQDRTDLLCLPGNIDLHTHLSQHRIRGIYEPSLLDWLQTHVYPEEALFADPAYAEKLSADFFQALFAAGTTTGVIYTAPFRQACELAFSRAKLCGARAFIGMKLITVPPRFCNSFSRPASHFPAARNSCPAWEDSFRKMMPGCKPISAKTRAR